MQPELRLVRYWVAVAEEANITRAAERLHISQPALSAAIKQLEQQLGVALLDRSGRVVEVTDAGRVLLEQGRELLGVADRVFDAVRARDSAAVGRLRIGMSPTARYGPGPELLAALAREAPALMVYTSEDTTGNLLRDLLRHAAVDRAHVDAQAGGEPDRLEARAPVDERHVDVERALVAGRGAEADRPHGEVLLLAERDEREVAAREGGGDHGEHREDAEGPGHPGP